MSQDPRPVQRRRLQPVSEEEEDDEAESDEGEDEDEEELTQVAESRRKRLAKKFIQDEVSVSGDDEGDDEESELAALEADERKHGSFISTERCDRTGREQRDYHDSVRAQEIAHEAAEDERYLRELRARNSAPLRPMEEDEPSISTFFAPRPKPVQPQQEAEEPAQAMEVDDFDDEKKDEPMVPEDTALLKTFLVELTKFSNAIFEQRPEDFPLLSDLRCYTRDTASFASFVPAGSECVRIPSSNFALNTVVGDRWARDNKGVLFSGVYAEPGVQPPSAASFFGGGDTLPEDVASIDQAILRELNSYKMIVLNPRVINADEHIDLLELLEKIGFTGPVAVMYESALRGVDDVSQPLSPWHPEANALTIQFIEAALPVLGNPRSDFFARLTLEFHCLSARTLSPFLSKINLESLRNVAGNAGLMLYRATQQGILLAPLPIVVATQGEARAWNDAFARKFTGEAKHYQCTTMGEDPTLPLELQDLSVALFRRHRVMLMCDVGKQLAGALGTVVDLFDGSVDVFFDQTQDKMSVPLVLASSQIGGVDMTYMYLPLTPAFALPVAAACAFANVADCIFSGRDFSFCRDLFIASRVVAGRRWFTSERP